MSSIRRFSATFVVLLCLQFFNLSAATAQDYGEHIEDPSGHASEPVAERGWSAQWGRPGWFDAALTAGLFAGGAAIQLGIGPPDAPRWRGPVLADGFMRDSVMATTPEGLAAAGNTSDILLVSLIAIPALLEPGLAWMAGGDAETAGRLALINAQALGATFFATTALKHTIGRERPPIGACWDNPDGEGCDERDRLSFPSGHTSMAFAGAGLVCLNHEQLQPFGNGWDKAACYTALGAATATGVLRMASNAHYMTDVVAGAALGLAAGYVLPKWLYFGFGDSGGILADHDATITPSVGEVNGVNFSFTW